MLKKEYPGYPEFVFMSIPKSGHQTLNRVFKSLGYKVFGALEITDYGVALDDYGKNKITFPEMAKTIWENNELGYFV